MSILTDLKTSYTDTPEYHQTIHEQFIEAVNSDPVLKAHRDYVEQNIWGFGERSFWWMWKVLLDELPKEYGYNLLEIGVFRGATLSVWRLLGQEKARICGITPLDTSGDVWESDYENDINKIHSDFNQPVSVILKGLSQDNDIIKKAALTKWDVVYIDGLHSYDGCLSDLVNYAPMVKQGGYLVIDDACCDMHMPWGYFQGIAEVTQATLEYIKEDEWEFITNCVHLRIYKRK